MARSKAPITALTFAMPLLALAAGASGSFAANPRGAPTPPPGFAQCKACHTVERGGRSGAGPNLFGVMDTPAGAKAGYAYSPAMKGANIRWNRANLDAFLGDPRGFMPGTRMMAPGTKDANKRKAIIDYLATLK